MRRSGTNKLVLIILWVIVSAFFVFIGYLVAGAVPESEMNVGVGFGGRLLGVLSDPLHDYFNDYSFVGMTAGFIAAEVIFGIIFLLRFSTVSKIAEEETILDGFDVSEDDEEESGEMEGITDKEEMPEAFIDELPTEETADEAVEKPAFKKEVEEENEAFMDEEVFLKLFNMGYNMPQINAMMEIGQYVDGMDVSLLTRMFKKEMSPENIRDYIEVMYG